MNIRECETCIKRKTIYCPNSSECLETEDKMHYQNRTMLLEQNNQLKEVIEEVKEVIRDSHVEVLKYHDEPSETTSYEIVTVELLKILDKVKEVK